MGRVATNRKFAILESLLSVVGASIAGTLWWSHRASILLPCVAGGGCDIVAGSRYASLSFGHRQAVPVALLGLLTYLLLFTLGMAGISSRRRLTLRCLDFSVLGISALAVCYSLYLQYVAHFVLKAFCSWCFASAAVITLLFLIASANIYAFQGKEETRSIDSKDVSDAFVSNQRIFFIWLLALMLLAPLIFSFTHIMGHNTNVQADIPMRPPKKSTREWNWPKIVGHAAGNARGRADTPFTMVEFGDFECESCASIRVYMERLVSGAPHSVNMLYVHRPIPEKHRHAMEAAEAAEVAAAHGRFWEMYDSLYQNHADLDPRFYREYAEDAGLEGKQFQAEYDAHKYRTKVARDSAFSLEIGIRSTPTIMVHDNRRGTMFLYTTLEDFHRLIQNPPWSHPPAVDPLPILPSASSH
jgi:uncharacterized membrane protein